MEWISVEDKLPSIHEWVILANSEHQMVTFGIYLDEKFLNPDNNYHEIANITHWMPLPKPPEVINGMD